MRTFTLVELKFVVFSLPPNKAHGPDGFTALFFQKGWDFLCFELLWALEESRRTCFMLRQFNVTNIAILPKFKEPKTFVKFRPISLCNTIYKLFTKSIYLRLQPLIPRIISHEQGGFIPRRETYEGAVVAHEVLHTISSSKLSSFIVKLDMMKSYDKVD